MKKAQRIIMLAAAAGALLTSPAGARTINWGDAALGNDLQSDGTDIDVSFTFEIGTFGSSFIPDETNFDMWAANWKVLDSATYNETFDIFTSTFQLTAHPTLPGVVVSDQNPGENFAIGEQAYIWVYNTTVVGPTTEWALFTDNDTLNANDWTLPAAGDQGAEPLDWRQTTATVPVFGGLNDVTGPGERTDMSTLFQFQTHKIPEPSSALLLVGGIGLLIARRRRPNTERI